jgi:uncharacterized cupredoxin-like copper-binding protein
MALDVLVTCMNRTGHYRIPIAGLLAGALALSALSACTRSQSIAASATSVGITLHDFRINSSLAEVRPGPVAFHIHNAAPATHEFVVVRTDLPADILPMAPDGLSVNEDLLYKVGEDSEVPTESTGTLVFNLRPGHYVFFCNLEGHYLGGMHASLTVTGGASGG